MQLKIISITRLYNGAELVAKNCFKGITIVLISIAASLKKERTRIERSTDA